MGLDLIFETHSTSLDNEAGLASGWYDTDLSPAGEQALELGRRRGRDAISEIFCSDLRRPWRTAQLAFADGPAPISRDARLREIDYGALTRAPRTVVDAARAGHVDRPFPGGESYAQAAERVRAVLEEVAPSHDGECILLIGHAATQLAIEHLVHGRGIADLLAAPFEWQRGWEYRYGR